MKGTRYTVVRADPSDVRDDLMRLWQENLPEAGDCARKFDWWYREAPEPPTAVFLLAAEGDGERRWVGTAGVGIRRVQVRGREVRAGLLADLAVDREHRTLLPALSLVRTVKEWALGEMELVYGFPNHLAEGVFRRVGYQPLGTLTRWVRVLRHAPYASRMKETELPRMPRPVKRVVDRAADVRAIAAVAGSALDVVQLARIAPSAVQAARRIKLSWCETPDERIDAIWETARGEYEVAGVRSARFLAWRYAGLPDRAIAVASARATGEPLAYAIVDHLDRVASVRDVFGRRDAVLWLLDLLVPALYPRGAIAISMRHLGAPWLVDALVARGWVPRQAHRQITVGVSARLDEAERAAVTAPASWHLTDADEDV